MITERHCDCILSDYGANRLGASALMQGLSDGYFVIPYTMQNYLSDQIQVKKPSTDAPEFVEAEKNVQAEIDRIMDIQNKQADSTDKFIVWSSACSGAVPFR